VAKAIAKMPHPSRNVQTRRHPFYISNVVNAVEALSVLVAKPKDRDWRLTLLERVLADRRVQRIQTSADQKAMLARIRGVLGAVEFRPAGFAARSRLTVVRPGITTAKARVALTKKSAGAA
jgi:hypothetical protein